MVPFLLVATTRFGAIGAATGWLGYNVVQLLLGVSLTHRHILKGEQWKWYTSICRPLLGALAVVGLSRCLLPIPDGRLHVCVMLMTVGIFAMMVAASTTSLPAFLLSQKEGGTD